MNSGLSGLFRRRRSAAPANPLEGREFPTFTGTKDPRYIVIYLHGFTGIGSAEILHSLQMAATRENRQFALCYPRGTGTLPSWNAKDCCGSAVKNQVDDLAFLEALVAELKGRYGDKPVFLLGHSNGGMLVHTVAPHLGRAVSAIATVAAGIWPTTFNGQDALLDAIIFNAADDAIVPTNGGRSRQWKGQLLPYDAQGTFWARGNHSQLHFRGRSDRHLSVTTTTPDGNDHAAVEQYLLRRGGHFCWDDKMRDQILDFFERSVPAA